MSAENRLTSIVSYPERGTGGNNRYRGNCSPKLIEDLIGFFKPAEICDYMCGSGTTQDAAHSMGIISHCYDLHSGFDLINCEIPERPEFVFWHPPYWDMITYSDVMYKASEVQSKYGYDPRQFDLSRIPKWEDFVRVMNYAMMKQFCALERGGRMAVLVGDIKKKGQLYSMLFELIKPGTLENVKGFCAVATTEEIAKQDYILTPGRYVGIEEQQDDGEPFEEKMARLTSELSDLFVQSHKLEAEIKEKLGAIGYEI